MFLLLLLKILRILQSESEEIVIVVPEGTAIKLIIAWSQDLPIMNRMQYTPLTLIPANARPRQVHLGVPGKEPVVKKKKKNNLSNLF